MCVHVFSRTPFACTSLLVLALLLCLGFTANTAEVTTAEQRLVWNKATLSGAYKQVGLTNAGWDKAAIEALDNFALLRSTQATNAVSIGKSIAQQTKRALAAGCEDPLVRYLYLRYTEEPMSEDRYCREMGGVADRLIASKYPDIRKTYAAIRAAQLWQTQGSNSFPVMHHYRRAAMRAVTNVVADKQVPVREIDDVCNELLSMLGNNPTQLERFYKSVETPLFQNWPDHSSTWHFKGAFYISYAWAARGFGLANTVTEPAWKLFRERLAVAADALERAWRLNRTDVEIPISMLRVELGQGKGRDRLELWFKRAMAIDTNSYAACLGKLHYLEPKWFGSREDMLEFARACLASTNWGGHVPLVLVDAHVTLAGYQRDEEARRKYWRDPGVWPDVKTAYEKFFKLNPAETGYRHNYARHAYWAQQWDDLNKQLPLLGPVNYEYFGGKPAFDKMVAEAAQHTNQKGR